jgi:hypothetical protein
MASSKRKAVASEDEQEEQEEEPARKTAKMTDAPDKPKSETVDAQGKPPIQVSTTFSFSVDLTRHKHIPAC